MSAPLQPDRAPAADAAERPALIHANTLPPPDEHAHRSPRNLIPHLSDPGYHSPRRHHTRQHSKHREIPETLDARSEYQDRDGLTQRRINQYLIKEEIGRGAYGSVHIATDNSGTRYAVKEFSKHRLRRQSKSQMLRMRKPVQPKSNSPEGSASPQRFQSPTDLHSQSLETDPLYLIRREIAVMKKLDHQNLVQLIEVLDDPEQDSLFLVLEMCEKGIVMKVDIGQRAEPYPEETCRLWFRDLILGVEYLHAQGVVHRDLKPENLLLTEDNTLKISDFGVSEIFENKSSMRSSKSSGSPAFMAPEMCVPGHGELAGDPIDIWAMGTCLFCLRFGRLPFEHTGLIELWQAIQTEEVKIPDQTNNMLKDLLERIFEKDPEKRIKLADLRKHPWVTLEGKDPLLSTEENISDLPEPPTEDEVKSAITKSISQIVTVMRAVRNFKALISNRIDRLHNLTHSPSAMTPQDGDDVPSFSLLDTSKLDHDTLRAYKHSIIHTVASRVSDPDMDIKKMAKSLPRELRDIFQNVTHHHAAAAMAKDEEAQASAASPPLHDTQLGHAHPPEDDPPIFLNIGTGIGYSEEPEAQVVSAPPQSVEEDMFQNAYDLDVERIRNEKGPHIKVFKTNRVLGGLAAAQSESLATSASSSHQRLPSVTVSNSDDPSKHEVYFASEPEQLEDGKESSQVQFSAEPESMDLESNESQPSQAKADLEGTKIPEKMKDVTQTVKHTVGALKDALRK